MDLSEAFLNSCPFADLSLWTRLPLEWSLALVRSSYGAACFSPPFPWPRSRRSRPGGHLVAWRGGLPTTKLHLFTCGPGARFVGLEIHGVPQAPLSWPPVGADTNCEARWNSLRRLLGVARGEGGRSSPPGPGELGRVPGSFTGGQDWGVGPRSLPPSPSPSPSEGMAEGYLKLPVPLPPCSPASA